MKDFRKIKRKDESEKGATQQPINPTNNRAHRNRTSKTFIKRRKKMN
jgi:hypothetical protein